MTNKMKCFNCGAEIDPNSKFCIECGAILKADNSSGEPAMVKENVVPFQKNNNIGVSKIQPYVKYIELAVGISLVIVGFIRLLSSGTSISTTSFGGDFYTYTYQGIVAISELLSDIEASLCWLIMGIGASMIFRALKR